jgi:DNA replication protein DnaC
MAQIDLVEANKRLLQKRETLKATEHPGQQIENIDFMAVADRCRALSNDTTFTVVETPKEPEKPMICIIDIPHAYRECCFDNYKGNDKLIKDLQNIIPTLDGLVLRGNTGCGKTHLALAIAKQIPTRDRQQCGWSWTPGTVFTTAPELLLKIRSAFRDDAKESEEQLINYYSGCELLILDDLGSEKTSEFAVTTLYVIIDRRIRDCRKTIITTNMSQQEIEQTFGARIASRLSGMVNIKINMPDYRKKRG